MPPWISTYLVHILLSLAVLAFYFVLKRIVFPRFENYVEAGELRSAALLKAMYLFRVFYGIVSLALILTIWGFDFEWLLALSSGIVALTGVALFAQWSMLSNVTAFFILLVHKSYRRGNFIRVIEGDNYVEGFISEINVFNTVLLTERDEPVLYPNNLLITRPTVFNPAQRFNGVGKVQEFVPPLALPPGSAAPPAATAPAAPAAAPAKTP